MSSYFDEHNCEPLGDNEAPNNQILLARFLLDSGFGAAMGINFEAASSELPPPTSKEWLTKEFPNYLFNETEKSGQKCPICLKVFSSTVEGSQVGVLPGCKHCFHDKCILAWLERTSNCPLCRSDLPTDNEQYEAYKKHKKREKAREQDLADLHDSMFS